MSPSQVSKLLGTDGTDCGERKLTKTASDKDFYPLGDFALQLSFHLS